VLASTNETSGANPPVADGTLGTAINAGTVTANAIETFNINSTAVDVDGALNVITANGNAVTKVDISGNAGVNLTSTASTLKTVDAEDLTAGGLTFSAGNEEMDITGGAGVDTISIGATANKTSVAGGEGNDIFNIAASADQITIDGGAGADTFNFAGVSTNKSNYTVIEGIGSGDKLVVTGATSFQATEITLSQGATESTQAYLDQAMTDLAAGGLGWFQYNGNTFIAADLGADSPNAFVDGTDGVVMLTGLVDLSTATFNTAGTLVIA
jgi:S-layer protein